MDVGCGEKERLVVSEVEHAAVVESGLQAWPGGGVLRWVPSVEI